MSDDRSHILPINHPLYTTQREFMELACRSRAENAEWLYEMAVEDYYDVHGPVPSDVKSLLHTWSRRHATINREINKIMRTS